MRRIIFLQAGVGDELVVYRLHRVLEGLLLHRHDLRAAVLDDLARCLLALVPQLAHERHRFLRRLLDDQLVVPPEVSQIFFENSRISGASECSVIA